MKRREVIIALVLLGIGVCYMGFRIFFDWFRSRKADLSQLTLYGELVDELAETIIPETDTPGAKSAGVGATVFLLVEHCLGEREQSVFLYGLAELDKYSKRRFGHVFAGCRETDRLQALDYLESNATFGGWFVTKVRQRLFGKPFIVLVKELCTIAYCRSMQGATLALAYDPIPARYDACVVIEERQCSWALV